MWSLLLSTALAGTVEIAYSGGLRGIGSERYTFELHERVGPLLDAREITVEGVDSVHGLLSQGPWTVVSGDAELGSLLELVARGPSCKPAWIATALRTSTERLVFPDTLGDLADELDEVRREDVRVQDCRWGDLQAYALAPVDTTEPLVWDLEAFDIRRGHRIRTSAGTLYLEGRPRQEASRRIATLDSLLRDLPQARFVDAGDFVDGASAHAHGAVSSHRDYAFELLAGLDPVALVPGTGELLEGPGPLLAKAAELGLPYTVSNWQPEDPALALPDHLRHTFHTADGDVDVAFVGVVDPEFVLQRIGPVSGVTFSDPVDAVSGTVAALRAAQDPPDAILVVGQLQPEMVRRFNVSLHGVDLLLGNTSAPTLRVAQSHADLRAVSRAEHAAPLTLPLDGVARLTLELADDRLTAVDVRPLIVDADLPAADDVRQRVTAVRRALYPQYDHELVPAPDPMAGIDEETWNRLVCEAVLEHTGADVALLADLPFRRSEPGSMTALQAAERLSMPDHLEIVPIDGDRMVSVLNAAAGDVPLHCGAPLGTRFPRVRGRWVLPDRTYRVATTDRTRLATAVGAILDAGASDLVGHRPKVRPVEHLGESELLRHAVLRRFESWNIQDDDWTQGVVARTYDTLQPLWLLHVRRLNLQAQYFRGSGTDRFALVPETLVNSPTSFTLGTDVDVALDHSSAKTFWDLRFRLAYAQLLVQGEDPAETADDLRVSTSLTLPMARFPSKGFGLMPYLEVLFDTEVTPVVDSAGVLPRQGDLSLTAGLSSTIWQGLRRVRLGAFVNRDMIRLDDKATEYGGRLEVETRHDLARASAVRLSTMWDLQVFGNTPLDDEADLRSRLWGELRLSFRLYRYLSLSTYAQALVVSGRIPETLDPAATVTAGASLDLAAAFRLFD